ncbi:MAG TPA: LCP family protein [Candidatus Merdenecus merdavium]|nr:LCP family protein [Candidatus Merdenecus merdavium]
MLTFFVVFMAGAGGILAYGNHLLNKMDQDDGVNAETQEDVFETGSDVSNLESVDLEEFTFADEDFEGRNENGVYNILLLGEDHDNQSDNYRGNTDAMMVATINSKENTVKLTSFMRDMYVQIPNYTDNKLNSVYAKGGIQLVYDVFIKNFDMKLDGYVLVNFSKFEKIIDKLGGVEITLSKAEAEYLNTTNYISVESDRNVVEGTQILNGAQALGYSRVRHIGNNDYQRTERQRNVLTAIFNKFRSKNIVEMTSILEDILGDLKTDMDAKKMISIAKESLGADLKDLETYRIPVDNSFKEANIRGMAVLVVDFQKNIDALHEFVFEDQDDTLSNTDQNTEQAEDQITDETLDNK